MANKYHCIPVESKKIMVMEYKWIQLEIRNYHYIPVRSNMKHMHTSGIPLYSGQQGSKIPLYANGIR
jgi:hypothetical protein